MILLGKEKSKYIFLLPQFEKKLLVALLNRYPLVPPKHQVLSKTIPAAENDANQQLLEESLAEHREQNRRRLRTLLRSGRHFKRAGSAWRLILSPTQMDRLLQALNDIRLGCWIGLGSPEYDLWDFELNEASAPAAWAMETAGWFEVALLEAMAPGDANEGLA